ncbi:HdeD family acid-resistance protein [Solirubrobacter soli]|uniref:HdeD family acid-resistance protein n=1 Tax=Solirubrobacter soli TaxID=363832 RepID=UPI0003FA64D2|nr:DUF308 domain-containing protein [Solirubrobacter soli]
MSSAVDPGMGSSALGTGASRVMEMEAPRMWWLWLVTGIAWIVASLVILQFDKASVTTVGVIIGCMFVFAGIQQLVLASFTDHLRWLWITFGVLMLIAGVIAFVRPEKAFAGFADILGFLFLLVGVWWTIEAFVSQSVNPLWWLTLISGILMLIMAFWTAGQFFIEKAYILLVFAGVWALMHGVTDIVRAFQIRKMREI